MSNAQKMTGNGTRLYWLTSGYEADVDPETINPSGIDTEALETTDLATEAPSGSTEYGGRTYIPGDLENPGTISMDIYYDPSVGPPPKTAEQIRLVYPDGSYHQGEGFRTGWTPGRAAVNGILKASITIQRSGLWTLHAA